MNSKKLTAKEAWQIVQVEGADNVMVQRDFPCDDEECGCTDKNPCWYGLQQGDDPSEFTDDRRFELWY